VRREREEAKQARADAEVAARREREQAAPATSQADGDTKALADTDTTEDTDVRAAARQAKDEAKEAARLERVHAKEAARRERDEAKTAARSAKEAARAQKKADRVVEPPREPKVSFLERRRQKADGREPGDRNVFAILAVVIGALGLACSLVLAVGAFMAALGTTDSNGAYDFLSTICDALVGPLRDVFTFSGTNADMKEAVVAWGAGSMVYVLVGMFAQSYLRSRADD
jgi:hypothetical protein